MGALAAYKDFLTLWKDADSDIPIYKQAKAEYAKISSQSSVKDKGEEADSARPKSGGCDNQVSVVIAPYAAATR